MGDYTAPPAPATCESVTSTVTATADATVPVAYDQELDAGVCLDVDLTDAHGPVVDLDADASLE